MEFLGDAILGFIVSDALVAAHPEYPEGRLSKFKAQLVSSSHLHEVAARLRLGDYLLLGRGEEMSGGREKKALLANAVEALITALYLDGGVDPARRFILRHVIGEAEPSNETALAIDYKSALQELAQSRKLPQPRYAFVEERGPEHAKTFLSRSSVGTRLGEPRRRLVEEECRAEGGTRHTASIVGASSLKRRALCGRLCGQPIRFAFGAICVQDHHVDAAVSLAAFLSVVAVDRVSIRVTGHREPIAGNAKLGKQFHQRDAARGRKLPIAAKARIVDWDRVCMSFGARRIPHFIHGVGDLLDGGIEIVRDLIFARWKQRGLRKTDREAA